MSNKITITRDLSYKDKSPCNLIEKEVIVDVSLLDNSSRTLEDSVYNRKTCNICSIEKNIEEFKQRLNRKKERYYEPVCLDCTNKKRRKRYWDNPIKERRRRKVYRLYRTPVLTKKEVRDKLDYRKAQRLSLRLANAKLIIEISKNLWNIDNSIDI